MPLRNGARSYYGALASRAELPGSAWRKGETVPTKRRNGDRGGSGRQRRVTAKRTRAGATQKRSPAGETILREAQEMVRERDLAAVERWASVIQTVFRPTGFPPKALVSPTAVLDTASRANGPAAALVAKAVATFGPIAARFAAERLYRQLRAQGLVPSWIDQLGRVTPGRVVMHRDDYGDGYSIFLDCERPGGEARAVGVFVDVNMGGIVTDCMDGTAIAQIIALAEQEPYTEIVPIDPAEARALVEAAFLAVDETFDPPGDQDVDDLRALVEQRFSLLPAGGQAPQTSEELDAGSRQQLIDAFLASRHAEGLGEDATSIAATLCDFAGYSDGNPLRWSPTVVAIFLGDWVPRKVVADDRWLAALPAVVSAWVQFAGEQRSLAPALITETTGAIDHWTSELQAHVKDPDAWGIGKQLVAAMDAAGVNPKDSSAIAAFIEDYNRGLSLDDDALEAEFDAWERLDAAAVEFLRSALPDHRHVPPPRALAKAAAQVRAGFRKQAWPFDYLTGLLDLRPDELGRIGDVDLLLAATAAFIEPDGLGAHGVVIDPEELALANTILRADWAHVVTLAVRAGPGADLSPHVVAGWIADEAEDDEDRDLVKAALELNAPLWRAVGVTDDADRLTALGSWLLPRALAREWDGDFDE